MSTTTSTTTTTTQSRGWARTHGISRGLGRTLAVFVPVFFLGTFITFALRQLSGLSPAHLQLGESATPEKVAQLEAQWGLDQPFLTQYWNWLTSVLHGDLGLSWVDGTSISSALFGRAIISLSIAGLALVIGVTVGFALGTIAALWQTTWVDRAITGFTTVISVMPSFVVGIALVAVFAVSLGWFPSAGYVPISQGVTPWFEHIWLPALAISFDTIADVARQLRSGLIGAYRENYVVGAVVRGLGPRRIFFVHVLRNGVGPALTVLGMKFPNLLGGAVVTEAIFGLAGYGKYAADSAQRGDVPAVQGVLVVSIVVVVVFNLLVNTALVKITPASARGV